MAKWTEDQIRDISEKIYRKRLGKGEPERMIQKDGDSGEKLRTRAHIYDSLVVDVLETVGMDGPV